MPPDPRMIAEMMMNGEDPSMMGGPAMGAPEGPPPMGDPAMGAAPPMGDPSMGAPAPPMGDPMGGMSAAAPFPSIDPMAIAQIVMQIKGVQEQDIQSLQSQQAAVLAAVVQALAGGADPTMGVTEGAPFGAPEPSPVGPPPMDGGGMPEAGY